MLIELNDNETGDVLYSGTDPEAAQAVMDAKATELSSVVSIHAGPDRNSVIGERSAIDDDMDTPEDCDIAELVDIAQRRQAKVLLIYMNAPSAERRAG